MRLGFIGVGEITAAVVTGLCRAEPGCHAIALSPRGARQGEALAAAYPEARRMADNQSVIDAAELVFLAMRPDQARAALTELRFAPGIMVASFVAGLGLADLQALTGADRVCRVIPLPMIAEAAGPVLIAPAEPQVLALFQGLGRVILPADDAAMEGLALASALMSTFLEMTAAGVAALSAHGVPPEQARDYLGSLHEALSRRVLASPAAALGALAVAHETPGGINEHARRVLHDQGWFAQYAAVLDRVAQHARGLGDTAP